jgi:hypothetical protein
MPISRAWRLCPQLSTSDFTSSFTSKLKGSKYRIDESYYIQSKGDSYLPESERLFSEVDTNITPSTSIFLDFPSFSVILQLLPLSLNNSGIFQCAELIEVISNSYNHH